MLKPPLPVNEAKRIEALQELCILDTPPEERFDRLTRLTQKILDVPIALVSLVDAKRQWFKSRQGLEVSETPRDISLCGHAILGAEPLVVPDASLDKRFADNPLVTGASALRFYAGVPLVVADNQRVGTLCVIDSKPRELSTEQLEILEDLAKLVVDELQMKSEFRLTHDLQDQVERHRSVLDNIIDGVVTIDMGGSMESINPAVEQIFGYTTKELIGQNVKMLMPEPFHSAHDGYLDHYNTTGERRIIGIGQEVTGRRKDGSTFPMGLAVGEMQINGEKKFTGIVRDITERKRDEASLLEYSLLVESIVDTVVDAVITINPNGIIRSFNAAAERMFGYHADDIVGVNVKCLMPPPYSAEHDGYLANYMKTGERRIIGTGREVTGLRKDGSTFAMTLAVSEASTDTSRIFTGVVRDITDRKQAEADLLAAKHRAEESDQLKSAFLATMSHELRTPLNSIIGFTGIVIQGLAGPLTDEQKKQLNMVQGSALHLLELINDVLDLSKIEAGQLEILALPFDMRMAIDKVAGTVAPLASAKGLSLEVDVEPEVGMVCSDRLRVEQVLINLANNAIKFTDKGKVRIECTLLQEQVVTRVVDTGIGIKADDLAMLFTPFQQVETGLDRNHEGTGLGLSICKKLTDAMGGQISVESDWGTGSVFTLSIPVEQPGETE